jgi:hypothetical protein
MSESEIEGLLLRLVPGLHKEWRGASEEEIGQIQGIAGQELPGFYRWFLSKMGRSAGSLAEPLDRFAARAVIAAYESGEVDPEPPFLFIARLEDPLMPQEMFYDLRTRTRDDALVVSGVVGDRLANNCETLREWVARTVFTKFRVHRCAQQCQGCFKDSEGDVAVKLAVLFGRLGFACPIPTGPFCGIYERADAAVICGIRPKPENTDMLVFEFGAANAATLRNLLGMVATETAVEISIDEWTPPLSE